jgi:hypothetical protein
MEQDRRARVRKPAAEEVYATRTAKVRGAVVAVVAVAGGAVVAVAGGVVVAAAGAEARVKVRMLLSRR